MERVVVFKERCTQVEAARQDSVIVAKNKLVACEKRLVIFMQKYIRKIRLYSRKQLTKIVRNSNCCGRPVMHKIFYE
jgi:hypothetical protein